MNVLLVEPNHKLGGIYKKGLEKAGHNVSWSRTAAAAIAAADKNQPNVVILELQLAGHSGVEFLYEFCSYSDWQGTPIIIQSTIGEEQFALQKEQLARLGVVKYLYKPATNLPDLIRVINELPVLK